ncbi:hypothetical protein GSI01S_36_00030 [Gordonia sihwensis NBRC 108236]|uniref:Transmembrane protein n=3 Tax=Gordoniaceae TaxID=85026 RepID=L7LR21_9ACTN|nr:hypothetical protein GSI01S_36_00030 [Gordonia sihwensis NBRC 108236]
MIPASRGYPSGMDSRPDAARRDAEKRWGHPKDLRSPALFLGAVVVIALGVLVAFVIGGAPIGLAAAVPGVLGVGGLVALAMAFRAYRRGRSWVEWQGVGWLLLTMMLPALILPFMAASAP